MNHKKIILILFIIGGIVSLYRKWAPSEEKEDILRINEYYYAGDYETTRLELDSHLKKYPNSSGAWAYLGLVNVALSDTNEGEKAYLKAIELNPDNDKALLGMGIIYRMRRDYTKAREYYGRAIKANPRNPQAYSSLLMIELKDRNYAHAVALGEKAMSFNLHKPDPGVMGNLVVAYHLNNQMEERDRVLSELEKLNYSEIENIKLILANEVDIDDYY